MHDLLVYGIIKISKDWISFWAENHKEISFDEAEKIQEKLGYNPMGYGFYSFKCFKLENGWRATWKCQGSCD